MYKYNVLHFSKMKTGSGAIGAHIDRYHISKNVNEKDTHLNKELIKPRRSLKEDISRRINRGYNNRKKDGSLKNIRPDAVRAIGTIISGSHKQMKKLEKEGKLDEWAYKNLEWMEKKFGADNIVRFTVHMDEKTPHIHAVFVPLTEEGKLSAKEILGNKKKLQEYQDQHAELNKQFGLERGQENTIIKHTTTREYYRDIDAASPEVDIKVNPLGVIKKGEQERIKNAFGMVNTALYNAFDDNIRLHKELQEKKKLADEKHRDKVQAWWRERDKSVEKLARYTKKLDEKAIKISKSERSIEDQLKKAKREGANYALKEVNLNINPESKREFALVEKEEGKMTVDLVDRIKPEVKKETPSPGFKKHQGKNRDQGMGM